MSKELDELDIEAKLNDLKELKDLKNFEFTVHEGSSTNLSEELNKSKEEEGLTIDKEINKNAQKILNEEKEYKPSKGFDFELKNTLREDFIRKQRILKDKIIKTERDKIKKFLIFTGICYLIILSIFIISISIKINNKIENSLPTNQKIENVAQKDVLYTNTVEGLALDINKIEKTQENVTIKYTLKNNGDKVQPLFENSTFVNENQVPLIGILQYSDIQNKTLSKGEATEGLITYKNKQINSNGQAVTLSELKGTYKFTMNFINLNGIQNINIDINLDTIQQ